MQALSAGRTLTATVVAAMLATSAARAQDTVITRHHYSAAGLALDYTAEAGRITIHDAQTGAVSGQMFFTAYRVPSQERPRPVTFLWNGGPGADSTPLHFEAFGPRRLTASAAEDNEYSLLPESDLVFVDPIGTGFSRAAAGVAQETFYSTLGDFAAAAQFVQRWVTVHDAEAAPVFLVGESFGSWRVAAVAQTLEEAHQRVAGIVLISGGAAVGNGWLPRPLATALRVPGRAATALYLGKLDPALGGDRDSVVKAATDWATNVYAPALSQLKSLSKPERAKIAEALARFTGLKPDQIDRETLAVTPRQYLKSLVAGRVLNTFDMRYINESEVDPTAIDSYFRHELGYDPKLSYAGIAGQPPDPSAPANGWINYNWTYNSGVITPEAIAAAQAGEGPPGQQPWTLNAIRLDPKLKVMVAAGLYDSLNSCAANEAIMARLPSAVAPNFVTKCYIGGHMMYRDPDAHARLSTDVGAFISGASQH